MGEARSTVWKYSGRNTTAPKRAKPTISDSDPATAKTRSRISDSGRIGSAARLSTNRNSAISATPSAPTNATCPEPQAQVVPPRLVTSTISLSPAASNPAPR